MLSFFVYLGKLTSEASIADILDKGSGALILLDGMLVSCLGLIVRENGFWKLYSVSPGRKEGGKGNDQGCEGGPSVGNRELSVNPLSSSRPPLYCLSPGWIIAVMIKS